MDSEKEKTKLPRSVARDKIEFDNTYHPGLEIADLVHKVHGHQVGERGHSPGALRWIKVDEHGRPKPELLCHNCGWNSQFDIGPWGYTSRLKVEYVRGNNCMWELGPNGSWLLRDEMNNPTNVWKKDYTVQQYIRKLKPSIPLVEMHRFGEADEKFHFTMMARAKGQTMGSLWGSLTTEQQTDVLLDLKEHIKQWRQITSPQMQNVDGSELYDCFIANCSGLGRCIKTGHNEEEWLENLTPAIRKHFLEDIWFRYNKGRLKYRTTPEDWLKKKDPATRQSWVKEADEKVAQLKAKFPRGGPYVLTHGDLHPENIFISDDNEEKKFKVSAIIDWELAGFFPWWVEYARFSVPTSTLLGANDDICHEGHDIKDIKDVMKPAFETKRAWDSGATLSKHHRGTNRWYRQPFCACKPYTQEFRDVYSLGWEQGHLDVFDVDSETDDEFEPEEREFLRWFMEIERTK